MWSEIAKTGSRSIFGENGYLESKLDYENIHNQQIQVAYANLTKSRKMYFSSQSTRVQIAIGILLSTLFLFPKCSFEQKQKGFVFDNSNLFDSSQISKLNALYRNHEKRTTNEIILFTTDSFYPDSTIEQFSINTFRDIGVGREDKDNGVLIVFSAPNRKVRIATGYGTERVLLDSIAKKIIDSFMIPEFRDGRYFEGIWNGSTAIIEFLEKPENRIK